MDFQNKTVLVISPHTDDGELGCGGSIARMVEEGAEVHYIAFSVAEKSLPVHLPKDTLVEEVGRATQALGVKPEHLYVHRYEVRRLPDVRQEILEILIALRKETAYDIVLTPSQADIHQDHSTLSQETIRAFKNTTILGYEMIWNNLAFNATSFVCLQERHVEKKIAALAEYRSQHGRVYFGEEFIRSLLHARGVQIGQRYAESFEVIRWVMP